MRFSGRAALALLLACALPEAVPQSAAPAQTVVESVPYAKPQGIYATINTRGTESAIRQLGQLIPTPRREAIAAAVADFAFETTLASRHFAPRIAKLQRERGYRLHLAFLWKQARDGTLTLVKKRRPAGYEINSALAD